MSRILVVDDDSDTRDLLSRYLNIAGYDVATAANGWEALITLDETSVDLILLDVMMPGMNGITFLNIIRNAQKKMTTPVVIITALSPTDVASETRGLAVADIIPKTHGLFANLVQTVKRNLPLNPTQPLAHDDEDAAFN
jgi:two-component system OmpR family response regulator